MSDFIVGLQKHEHTTREQPLPRLNAVRNIEHQLTADKHRGDRPISLDLRHDGPPVPTLPDPIELRNDKWPEVLAVGKVHKPKDPGLALEHMPELSRLQEEMRHHHARGPDVPPPPEHLAPLEVSEDEVVRQAREGTFVEFPKHVEGIPTVPDSERIT